MTRDDKVGATKNYIFPTFSPAKLSFDFSANTAIFWGVRSGVIIFFFFKIYCSRSYYYVLITKKIIFYHIRNDFLQFSKRRWSNITRKVRLLKFGRLPVCQFSLDFSTKSDLGYFYLYLQLFLGSTKSGMSGEQRGKMRIMVSTLK